LLTFEEEIFETEEDDEDKEGAKDHIVEFWVLLNWNVRGWSVAPAEVCDGCTSGVSAKWSFKIWIEAS
jgi:hypothetical protein